MGIVCLTLLVKNESRSMRQTIESACEAVDCCVVLDTGSTDGTQQIARDACDACGIPLFLYEEPFVDFATSRNRSIDLSRGKATFALQLSGDEFLFGGPALRDFCKSATNGVYSVTIRSGGLEFPSTRLVRPDDSWRWIGVVHEYMAKNGSPPPAGIVPGAYITHEGFDPARKVARFKQDEVLLRAERARDPSNARAAFYLAQTLEDLGRLPEAFVAYHERIALGGWDEEIFEAKFRLGRISERIGRPWFETEALYLRAFKYHPWRAESLFAIAQHWSGAGRHDVAVLFAERAYRLPHPGRGLFIDRDVYTWKAADALATSAYYTGKRALGSEALRKALAEAPPEQQARLEKNLSFYAR